MKLEPVKFGLAIGLTGVVLWIICSLIVFILPEMSMSMFGHMVHMDISAFGWQLTLLGVMTGLVVWFVWAFAFGWLMAFIYNRLL